METAHCHRCFEIVHPEPDGPRFPHQRMLHRDGREECSTQPGHIGLPEHLTNG